MMKIDIPTMRTQMSEGDQKRDAGLTEPDTITAIKELTYGPHGIENKFDIYYPVGTTTCLPTIVSIHGGGFFYGDKELYRFYTMYLASQGFTVVNFNYRLAPTHHYPAPLEDTNTLMNWLLIHGKDYYVDTERLFLVGDSAGGQLAEQYSTLTSNPDYANLMDFTVANVHFKAVGLNCGAYFIGQTDAINQDFPFYFGETISEQTAKQFPVESYITADFPPAFITTATHDFLKDVGEPLANIIRSKGVAADFHLYANPDGEELHHVFHLDQRNPIGKQCNEETLTFFRNFL
ncbi:alpha/beta hydrolase [Vagococcus sp. BWB3-3]|uniref:Alpha/beta hydrolase n=1 Tax=Vagococcus allomyrinae TaxID=2794353 RepID=A0A940P6S8_9ENTE|nr:alpha/beta hydrolase [Vagococcus allomyrinae]MBP1039519.1 alpha/beta hydrolase [Vagococcus allomyrinae]